MNDDEYMAEPRGGRGRLLYWVALGVVILVCGVVVAAYFIGRGDHGSPAVGGESGSGPSSSPSQTSPSNGGGDVDPLGRALVIPKEPGGEALAQTGDASPGVLKTPLPTPAGLQWQRAWGVPMPFTTGDGPAAIDGDGVPHGFSRTPTGAAVAALQLKGRVQYGPTEDREKVLAERVVGGSDEQRAATRWFGVENNTKWDIGEDDGQSQAGKVLVPAGLRIRPGNWSENAATIDVAYGPQILPDGTTTGGVTETASYAWFPLSVVWRDGDWSLVWTDQLTGAPDDAGTIVNSLDGGEWATWLG